MYVAVRAKNLVNLYSKYKLAFKQCPSYLCWNVLVRLMHYVLHSGKDGSRAFVTGDFSDSGLTDDVSGLTDSQWLDLLHWFQFYDKQYIYIGMTSSVFLMYIIVKKLTNLKRFIKVTVAISWH